MPSVGGTEQAERLCQQKRASVIGITSRHFTATIIMERSSGHFSDAEIGAMSAERGGFHPSSPLKGLKIVTAIRWPHRREMRPPRMEGEEGTFQACYCTVQYCPKSVSGNIHRCSPASIARFFFFSLSLSLSLCVSANHPSRAQQVNTTGPRHEKHGDTTWHDNIHASYDQVL